MKKAAKEKMQIDCTEFTIVHVTELMGKCKKLRLLIERWTRI